MYEPMYHGYSSRSSGRLPPIQAIGKSQIVDEDEPPDIPQQASFGFEADVDLPLATDIESVFDSGDGEDVCKLLHKAFHMLGPGHHACKRNPDHGGSYFVHCRPGVKLGAHYSQLRQLQEERARLELVRDCTYRIHTTQIFVQELEGLVAAEFRTAYAIRHGCSLETPVSKLYCLNALCEDLRIHTGHWNSIKQRVNTNSWLKPILGFLCRDLVSVQQALDVLCDRAIFLLDRLIHVGFEVLAHCSLESITPDIMWNIARGLEDFNTVVSTVRTHSAEGLCVTRQAANSISSSYTCLYFHPALANTPGRLSDYVKNIPFTKVLGILANERSRYAAQLTNNFFTATETFLATLRPDFPAYEWEEELGSTVNSIHLQAPSGMDTSDYQTGSSASISAAMLHMGSVRVPDLSTHSSPLVEFLQKEQQFADSFLQIVSTSSSLLRKNDVGNNNNNVKAKSKPRTDFKVPLSPVVGRPPRVQSETPVLSRSDSRRKTVSWGDNADSSIRSQVIVTYFNILWQQFGRNLDLFLDEPAWIGKLGLLQSNLGTIFVIGDTINALLRHMIEHICVKDVFPPSSVSPLLGVALRLHALSAFAAWDTYLCAASSSMLSDKCYPCMLARSQYSTHTGQLIRDSYRPLLSLLQDVSRNMGQVNSGE